MRDYRHVVNQPSVSVAGNTGTLPNLGNVAAAGRVLVEITIPTVTGTTPSWTPRLQGSMNGTNWVDLGTFTAITVAGTYRLLVQDVYEPNVQVTWVGPTGTTPVFTSPTITILFPVR